MTALLGIDIGTSGTKTPGHRRRQGKILAAAMETYPCLLHPSRSGASRTRTTGGRPRSARSASVMAKARLKPADVKAIGLSGQMHGSVFLDKQRPGHPPGDPLERPAHGRRVRRDRAAGRRPREADQDGGQSGPDRLHRPENPLAAEPRAAAFRANRARCCCRKTKSAAG